MSFVRSRAALPSAWPAGHRVAPRAPWRALLGAALALSALSACGPADDAPEGADGPPTLIVLVAVDQLRGDLLERYDSLFTGGFRRLLDSGMVYEGASHRHAVTETAAGHATLATGVYPARHGIVANTFAELQPDSTLRLRYSVEDTTSEILGFPTMEGRSPANLLRPGLADWVLAADTGARVLSISTKDRSAITMGGREFGERVHVYWLNVAARRFVTSAFYRDSYPNWIELFNRERVPELLGDSVWRSRVPEAGRVLARADSSPYERGEHTSFPHLRAVEAPGDAAEAWAAGTPLPDAAVLALADEGIVELELGRRDAVDLLALGFSQTDLVGHAYGPFSQEQLDNLLHLDQVLDSLLTLLDSRVGSGRWVLGLSADHGVLTMPEHLAEQGLPGQRTPPDARDDLARRVHEADSAGADAEDARWRVAEAVEALPWVADVLVPDELQGEPTDSFAVLYRNSHRSDRRPPALAAHDLLLRPREHTLVTGSAQGTSHGSPYWYDRWVAFVLFGSEIEPGRSDEAVWTVDMAPSLALLAGIAFPDDLDGVARAGGS